jgi:hypothetical protein
MRIKFVRLLSSVLALSAFLPALAAPARSNGPDSSDAPTITLCGATQARRIGLKDKKCFVVIQNRSKAALNIWAEDCSWGWSNISFEVKAGSKVLPVKRNEINWKRNFPMPLKLLPGDICVREINLEDRTWSWNSVVDFCKENQNASISAKLEIEGDSSSKAEKVWTGAIRSSTPCELY